MLSLTLDVSLSNLVFGFVGLSAAAATVHCLSSSKEKQLNLKIEDPFSSNGKKRCNHLISDKSEVGEQTRVENEITSKSDESSNANNSKQRISDKDESFNASEESQTLNEILPDTNGTSPNKGDAHDAVVENVKGETENQPTVTEPPSNVDLAKLFDEQQEVCEVLSEHLTVDIAQLEKACRHLKEAFKNEGENRNASLHEVKRCCQKFDDLYDGINELTFEAVYDDIISFNLRKEIWKITGINKTKSSKEIPSESMIKLFDAVIEFYKKSKYCFNHAVITIKYLRPLLPTKEKDTRSIDQNFNWITNALQMNFDSYRNMVNTFQTKALVSFTTLSGSVAADCQNNSVKREITKLINFTKHVYCQLEECFETCLSQTFGNKSGETEKVLLKHILYRK